MKENLQATTAATRALQAGRTTIGMDLGDRWSRFCVLDQEGTIVEEDRVRTTAAGLEEQFGKRVATRIVVEAETHSPWVSRRLESCGRGAFISICGLSRQCESIGHSL